MSQPIDPLLLNNLATSDPLRMNAKRDRRSSNIHALNHGVCITDARGNARPENKSPWKIVLDASDGFIPLWAKDTVLRWRFQERSMDVFADPEAAKVAIEGLVAHAVLEWGDAVPVKFTKHAGAWDFEIVMKANDDCDDSGCVLASAFFPDGGRHQLVLYPKMFTLPPEEQVATIAHEIGHVFGLRHFFANITEKQWASVIFGDHKPFSIMNYGAKSVLTDTDRADLKRLYQLAWSGELTEINGTPIRLVKPFHALGEV